MHIRPATTTAELLAAAHLYDAEPRPAWAARFLAADGHLMLIAYEDGVPAGFVSGIGMLHPDKGTEMCLYELSVAEAYRRRGIGRALTEALAAEARERGCYDMWVGVERHNEAALATYRSAGAGDDGVFAMLTWEFTTAV
ncbi:GNAT family N-acetyltransferase [Streptomyces sp. NPDC057067]|uniref:GNAT family N-acetyltransferase n=1 Tax=Streptomyces TaxID=1883 RepID=UPI00192429FD|nr:GNAT family N-acetyltransferase [Streptomyces silvae]MBL1292208.1 GNAT family N-acetyltransferase [Streptomyces silvae]